ncbi:MAG: hypothetical protein ACTIM4_14355 [Marinomonas sp.]
MFLIKNFGNDQRINSIDELKSSLSQEYKDRHVSVVYFTKPHGLHRIIYVSIDALGNVRHSYGEGNLVDFSAIQDEVVIRR